MTKINFFLAPKEMKKKNRLKKRLSYVFVFGPNLFRGDARTNFVEYEFARWFDKKRLEFTW